jgi:Ser/Thr protein kinase RdoA (MazF antagonist)
MALDDAALGAAAEFAAGPVCAIQPLGRGLINDTFLVSAAGLEFVLQRINHRVFRDPGAVMANIRVLSDQVRKSGAGKRHNGWRLPEIVPTKSGADIYQDRCGNYWRALTFIARSRVIERLESTRQAYQVGRALGLFHRFAADIDPASMQDTLPGFHAATGYLARFDEVVAERRGNSDSKELSEALSFVDRHRDRVDVLERPKAEGRLKTRVIHGDPKLDNVLFDEDGESAISLIDLDTVKPGLVHYDLGDCLRSCCNRSKGRGHGAPASFDVAICGAILRGYSEETVGLLDEADRVHLFDAIRLLPFELGLRFLTDYLAGDVYFKVERPAQNLERAWVQFQLADSIASQEREIRAAISAV